MTSRRWQIGLIGCGWAGQQHARAIKALPERAEIRALADVNLDLAQTKAYQWQVRSWTDHYQELFKSQNLDAVSICLPHDIHAPAAIEALQAGLHVLVEKPLAVTLAQAEAMIAAAETAQVQLMVAENIRFHSTYLKVADLIQAGILGDIFLIRISREHEMHDYLRQRPWFLEQASAGIMMSGGIHDFELLRMLGGEIDHVYGLIAPKVLPEMVADDTSVVAVGLTNGVTALIVESFSLKTPRPGVHGTVHGSQGSLWFYDDRIHLYTAPKDGRQDLVEEIAIPQQDTFIAEITHFFDCLDHHVEPITSGREQRKPLQAVVATIESFRRGERVYLKQLKGGSSRELF